MCGLSACIRLTGAIPDHGHDYDHQLTTGLKASIGLLAHRGPDNAGIWVSEDEHVGLAHCRLAINDLSVAGQQPLHSSDNDIHVVVNGEIYDYDRLRAECETVHHYTFQGTSDSELVLALYKIHGAPAFLTHLRGEFAFVLYDSRGGARRVIAARDRYGIKPLVYTRVGEKLLVASEAKAFLPLGWTPRWDVRAIADAGWMFDLRTLFRGVYKVLPGHYLDMTAHGGVQQVRYWDAEYEDKVCSLTLSLANSSPATDAFALPRPSLRHVP